MRVGHDVYAVLLAAWSASGEENSQRWHWDVSLNWGILDLMI